MRHLTLVAMCCLAGSATARGQVLVTGETGGSGAQAVMGAANLLVPKDFSTLANYWVQYAYGVASRVDVFAIYGNISVFDETQHYVGGGSNVAVLRRDRHRLDVAVYSSATVPINKRQKASDVLMTLAVVASRPVKASSFAFTPYGGIDALVPVGHRDRGTFTPLSTLRAGVAGAAIPLSKTWTAFAEYNLGPNLQTGGVGIVVVFPRQP